MWKYKQLKLGNKPTFPWEKTPVKKENRIIMANFILYKLTESKFEDLWALANWFCQIYVYPLGGGKVSIYARALPSP